MRPKTRRKGLPITYSDGLELLARHGLRRSPTATARDFAAAVHAAYPAAGPAFEAITESYLAERFGGFSSNSGVGQHLDALREGLARATRSPNGRRHIKTSS